MKILQWKTELVGAEIDIAKEFIGLAHGSRTDPDPVLDTTLAAADFGSIMMTHLRRYYDNVDIPLTGSAIMPMCLPAGGANGVYDWQADDAVGSCVNRFGEDRGASTGMRQPDCNQNMLGDAMEDGGRMHDATSCAAAGCTWDTPAWNPGGQCGGTSSISADSIEATCNGHVTEENCGQDTYNSLCEWVQPAVVAVNDDRLEEELVAPLATGTRSASFVVDGVTYQCGDYPATCGTEDDGSDVTMCPASAWATDSFTGELSKCISGGFGDFTAEMFVVHSADGSACKRTTILDMNNVIQAWDGLLDDGSSVFSLKTTPSVTGTASLADVWFEHRCDGTFILRAADGLVGAMKIPSLYPILEKFVEIYRTVILADASDPSIDQCVTDEQIQSFFMPWTTQFGLTLFSGWSTTEAPTLLPAMDNPGKSIMESLIEDAHLEGCARVLSDCDTTYCSRSDDSMQSNWQRDDYDDQESCENDRCTVTRDVTTDPSCVEAVKYPSLTLPNSCNLAAFSAEPSVGCAMSYDLSWMFDGEPLATELHLAKCAHNPMSLSAVSVKCASTADGLCNYGRDWCSTATPCSDPDMTCSTIDQTWASGAEVGGDGTCDFTNCGGDGEADCPSCDIISFLMGAAAVPAAACSTRSMETCSSSSSGDCYESYPDGVFACAGLSPGEVEKNTAVAAGPMTKELVNFMRNSFSDSAYTTLPAGIGYCVPEDTTAIEDSLNAEVEQRITYDEDAYTLAIVGLNSATLPTNHGAKSGLESVAMTPPYGQETCGLVVVTQVVVPAAIAMPATIAAPVDETALQAALEASAPAGAEVVITAIETTVTSTLELPVGTTLDNEAKTNLKKGISEGYSKAACCIDGAECPGGSSSCVKAGCGTCISAAQVTLQGVRRMLETDERRQLQVAVTYEVATNDAATLSEPTATALTTTIVAADIGITAADIAVADPAQAVVAVAVEYNVIVVQDAGTDASAVTASLQETSNVAALATAMGVNAADMTVVVEEAIVVEETTTPAEAAAAGVTAAPVVAAPVACSGRWLTWGDCDVSVCTQTRTYNVVSLALNGGPACSATDGQEESQACSCMVCGTCGAPSPPLEAADSQIDLPNGKASGATMAAFGATMLAAVLVQIFA